MEAERIRALREMGFGIGAVRAGLLAYGVFLIFVFGCLIGGLVLFIVCLARRKFSFARGRIVIPEGKRFRTVALNLGMLLYGIFWIAVIVYQLLA